MKGPHFTLEPGHFLRHHWQREPLLLRQAIPDFRSPLSPETLAGLAMEAGVESRIIGHSEGVWALQHGPFTEEAFLRSDQWTLLVQAVDRLLPEVAALRHCVDFIPSWRFDDIMVSWAVDGGGVGPHFDRYDVFLLQGEGQRLWRLGGRCDEDTARLEHDDLQLLQHFETVQEFLLNPGDVLYVPPGVAHWGIAQGPCMTFSLGFRAPPLTTLMARMADTVIEQLKPQLLLEDRDSLQTVGRPGEITEKQRQNARDALINAITHVDDGRWLGELVTELPVDDDPLIPVVAGAGSSAERILAPWIRLAWTEYETHVTVFVAGHSLDIGKGALPVVIALCAGHAVTLDAVQHGEDVDDLIEFLSGFEALIHPELIHPEETP